MPATEGDVIALLKRIHADCLDGSERIAYVEQIVKHMGAGIPASTMAVYASSWGIVVGALMMAGWRVELVTPQAWQKALGLGITGRQKAPKGATAEEKQAVKLANGRLKREWKDKLKATAQRLYPGLTVTLKTADAVLILEYGRRCNNTTTS
jgi:hypothetical protein